MRDHLQQLLQRHSTWLVVCFLALGLSGCGAETDTGQPASSDAPTTQTVAPTTVEPSKTEDNVTASDAATATATATATSATTLPASSVEVHYSVGDGVDCAAVEPFVRFIDDDRDPIEVALDALVTGPTAEEAEAGADSFFSIQTTHVVSSVSLDEGVLVVDFADFSVLMPNASTSCGSEALLASLNSTLFQFSEIERIRYRFDGSCDAFANWLQRDCFDALRNGEMVDTPASER